MVSQMLFSISISQCMCGVEQRLNATALQLFLDLLSSNSNN